MNSIDPLYRWRDSEHFQRWMATACRHNDKRFRRIRGYKGLPALGVALQPLCPSNKDQLETAGKAA